jgi:RNA polymerase subunit RPABC4/transcription elongation factor Spt4
MSDVEDTEGFECASCGTEVSEQDRFCPSCGRELEPPDEACARCGGGFASGDRHCRNCGAARAGFDESDEFATTESEGDSEDETEDTVGDIGPRPIAARGLALRWLMMFVIGAGVVLLLSVLSDRGG